MFTIGEKIKQIREYFKLSQKDFGEKLKISTPYLSEIENNKKEVTSKIILNLNSEFNISSDWLLFSNSEFSSQLDNSNDNLNDNLTIKEAENISNLEKFRIEEKIKKLWTLYQRLIDIKMMNDKILGKNPESNLIEYTEQFGDVIWEYRADLWFTNSDMILTTSDRTFTPVNINEIKDIESYNNRLDNVLKNFEDVFFEQFRDFYKKYMENWYNKPMRDDE